MKALIVHNSDEVKACILGYSEEEILEKLKATEYWEDVVNRINDASSEDPVDEDQITLSGVTNLYHDGDSEDGYTLIQRCI